MERFRLSCINKSFQHFPANPNNIHFLLHFLREHDYKLCSAFVDSPISAIESSKNTYIAFAIVNVIAIIPAVPEPGPENLKRR